MSVLFSELKVGDLTLPNHVIMAPLTRCRASGEGRIPNQLMADYYAQGYTRYDIASSAPS